jgi:endoglucanase
MMISKFKLKWTILLLVAAAVFSDLHAQPVKQHGKLQVKGTQLCDKKGRPVVLRGMSFGWHNFWPRFYNEDAVAWLYKDWNCSVVRAAMGVEPRRGYENDSAGSVQKIKAVIDGAIKAGIYVIIDWHSHNINLQEAKTFFAQMAKEYGKYPNVIYELFNEPDHETWDEVKNYETEVINVIRKYDSDNIILLGSPHWDQDIHLVADAPLQGFSNIMYTVHFYAATHKQKLRDRCDYALKKGISHFYF